MVYRSFKFHHKGSPLNRKISVFDWISSICCVEKIDSVWFVSCDADVLHCTSPLSCAEDSSNSGYKNNFQQLILIYSLLILKRYIEINLFTIITK